MRRTQFKNVEWLEARPTIQTKKDAKLKYENCGARIWLHDPLNDVASAPRYVSREYFHAEKDAWILDEKFRAYTKQEVKDVFLKQVRDGSKTGKGRKQRG